MKLTVTTDDDKVMQLDMDTEEVVENLKAILEVETAVPLSNQRLVHNGKELVNASKLGASGVQDGDLIMMISGGGAAAPAANPTALNADGSAVDPIAFQNAIKANPQTMMQLQAQNPALAQALQGTDIEALQSHLRKMHAAQLAHKQQQERQQREHLALLSADPMDMEAQAKIAEMIAQKNIDENYESAFEHTPEAFGRVTMLYVDMVVNGVPLKAFVDSGAQSTIMSASCAEKCGIMRLLDKRFAGVAKGVGTSKILGRIHQTPLEVGGKHLPVSITVLENQDMEFLFGLDLLKRHQCCIDLSENKLKIGSAGVAVPFLGEGDLPMHLRGRVELWLLQPVAQLPKAVHLQALLQLLRQIANLMNFGFTREQAVEALSVCNGDVDQAASLLFG
eukprot:gene6872-8205_t